MKQNHNKLAHKWATTAYKDDKAKVNGESYKKVYKQIEEDYGIHFFAWTISRYVQHEEVGSSPSKNGNTGIIPQFVFQTLCTDMGSFISINQVNGQHIEHIRKKLHNRVLGTKDIGGLSNQATDRQSNRSSKLGLRLGTARTTLRDSQGNIGIVRSRTSYEEYLDIMVRSQ